MFTKLQFVFYCVCSALLWADFPIGVYMLHPDNDASHELIGQFGFDYSQQYLHLYSEAGTGATDKQLEMAAKHGSKVLLNLIRGDILEAEDGMQRIRGMIQKYKKHPALGMWYLFDEPSGEKRKEQLLQVYAMLKEESPDIPVALCLGWFKDYHIFKDCADILMPDIYPVKNQPFPEAPLNNFTHFIWNVSRLGKPVIPIAQIKNFKRYPSIMIKANIDPNSCRYPNRTELRHYSFAPLTMNVKGMFYYSFYDVIQDGQRSYISETAGPAVKELREFTDLVDGADFLCLTKQIGLGNPPEYLAASWSKGRQTWLVLANNTGKQLQGDFNLLATTGSGKLKPWGQTSSAEASLQEKKIILEHLDPWQVMVWRLEQAE
ncbi:MAG: hypothetical protein GX901_04910 [Lentisphaerae bacterium]|nr:hypothetical protein [Lentisphaerota bacterium]